MTAWRSWMPANGFPVGTSIRLERTEDGWKWVAREASIRDVWSDEDDKTPWVDAPSTE